MGIWRAAWRADRLCRRHTDQRPAENATKAAKPPPTATLGAPHPPAPTACFAVSLLALTAAMMQADGRAMRSELIVAQKFFIQQFGRNLAQTLMPILRDLLREEIPSKPSAAKSAPT